MSLGSKIMIIDSLSSIFYIYQSINNYTVNTQLSCNNTKMYEILIDISQVSLLDNPNHFNLQIPTKIFSSTKPPLSLSSPDIPYRVILYNSKSNDGQSVQQLLKKLQRKFQTLIKANFSDAGYQEVRDQLDRKNEESYKTDVNKQADHIINQRPVTTADQFKNISNNAPDLQNRSNQRNSSSPGNHPATSVFTRNTTVPASSQSVNSQNPFSTSTNSNSLFNNQSRSNSNSHQSQSQNQNNMNIFSNSFSLAQNNQSQGFNNSMGSNSGGNAVGMYSRQSYQSSGGGGGSLFIQPSRASTSTRNTSRGKKPNLG